MALPREFIKQLKESHGVTELRPIVRFFDHAEQDHFASKESGRPRFKPAVYIEKRSRDLTVRDVFHRRKEPEDEKEFAEEWKLYLKQRDELQNRAPSLKAIPGMDVASYEELKALELYDCERLANYTGNIEGLEHFKQIAQQIMRISDGICQKRDEVHTEAQRPVHQPRSVHGSGGIKTDPRAWAKEESHQEETHQEKDHEEVTFNYTFKVA